MSKPSNEATEYISAQQKPERPTIDQEELNKFNKTSEEWWNQEGEFKLLHQINPVRINYLKEKICQHFNKDVNEPEPLKQINILDIGSGGGLVSSALCQLGAKVTGLDANYHNIKAATEHAKEQELEINYVQGTVEDYAKEHQGKYDLVVCLEVIEHVANPQLFVAKICELVKKEGMLVFSTINRTVKSYLLAIIMAEYVLRWVPKKTHQYRKFIRPSELYAMFDQNIWRLTELKGLIFNPLEQNWQLSDNIEVNYFATLIRK